MGVRGGGGLGEVGWVRVKVRAGGDRGLGPEGVGLGGGGVCG